MKLKRKIISIALAAVMLSTCAVVAQYSAGAAELPETYSAITANPYGITDSNDNATILQVWNWSYKNLEKEIPKVAAQGFSVVQISPPNEIKEGTKGHKVFEGDSATNGWWMFYQPAGFQINESTDNALGTKAELVSMVKTAHSYGVRVIADSVINHMGTCDNEDKVTSSDPMDHVTPKAAQFEKEIYEQKLFHNPWFNMTYKEDPNQYNQYDSTYDLTRGCTSRLPDLKTESTVVQGVIYDYLQELVDCGIDGFRFDAAKHIETPTDITGLKSDFLKNTITKVKNYAKTTYKKDLLSYGEILNSCGVNRKYSAYFPYMKVTDSGVFWTLSNAVDSKNANSAKIGDEQFNEKSKTNAVLWDESHDTYMDGNTVGFSTEKRNKMWALTAARDGITSMYFARPVNSTNKSTFKNDLKKVNMGDANETDWATSKAVAGVNKFNNIFAGKGEYLDAVSGVTVVGRGDSKSKGGGAVLVNMSGTSKSVSGITVATMSDGTYKDIIGGGTFTVKSGKASGSIGSTGVAAIYPEVLEPTEPATEATTQAPTDAPTNAPTNAPTDAATQAPTDAATVEPTEAPTAAPTEAPTTKPSEFSKGDVNRDKSLNITDVTFIQKYLIRLLPFDDEQLILADYDGDGRVSIKDATAIQYALVKK